MTMALSPSGDRVPRVLYARGALWRVTPDSSVKEGMMAMCWSGIKAAKGFSGWVCVLSWTYSVTAFSRERGAKKSVLGDIFFNY